MSWNTNTAGGEPLRGKDRHRAYISSTAWQDFKTRYKTQRPWVCFVCQTTERLDLHHITYKRLGQEELEDCVPLCRLHHQAVHQAHKAGHCKLKRAHLYLRYGDEYAKRGKRKKRRNPQQTSTRPVGKQHPWRTSKNRKPKMVVRFVTPEEARAMVKGRKT